jgi:hypothetical protein
MLLQLSPINSSFQGQIWPLDPMPNPSPEYSPAELEEMQTMQESMANLARQINDLKSKQNNPQWWNKQKSNPSPYKSNNPDTKKHGNGGRGGRGRGRGRGQQGNRPGVRCHNCGLD